MLLLNRSHQALGVTVLLGAADRRHRDADASALEQGDVLGRCVLPALVRVVNLGRADLQSALQSYQGQIAIQAPRQEPAGDGAQAGLHARVNTSIRTAR